jgi:hypothetical protein
MNRPNDRLTTSDISREYGVSEAAVRKRRSRGQLRPVGYANDRTHAALYRRVDVERTLPATRRDSPGGGGER